MRAKSFVVVFLVLLVVCSLGQLAVIPQQAQQGDTSQEDGPSIISIDRHEDLQGVSPELFAALRRVNDDPSMLNSQTGENVVDFSNMPQISEERMQEMEEVFSWLESQLPPDDPTVIRELLGHLSNDTFYKNDTEILNDLEYMRDFLHQVDNGVDFGKMNGMEIMLAYLNDGESSIPIKTSVVYTMGLACQNNPGAIEFAHKAKAIPSFLYYLHATLPVSKEQEIRVEVQDDGSNNVAESSYLNLDFGQSENCDFVVKLLYASSSMTRQDTTGLKTVIDMKGDDILYRWSQALLTSVELKDISTRDRLRITNKLLAYVSDIVALNAHDVYSQKLIEKSFLSEAWARVMIEGLTLNDYSLNEVCIRYLTEFGKPEDDTLLRDMTEQLTSIARALDTEDEFDQIQREQATQLLQSMQQYM